MHVDARDPQARSQDRHLGRPRPAARRGHPGRGDEPHPRPLSRGDRSARRRVEAARAAVRPSRPWIPRVAGAVCLTIGVLDVAAASPRASGAGVHLLTDVLPGAISQATVAALLAVGIGFMLLGGGLARRKRRAWQLAVVLLAASVVCTCSAPAPAPRAGRGVAGDARSLLLALPARVLRGRRPVHAVVGAALPARPAAAEPPARARWSRTGSASRFAAPGRLLVGRSATSSLGLVGVPTPLDQQPGFRADVVYYALLALGLVTLGTDPVPAAARAAAAPAAHARRPGRACGGCSRGTGDRDSLGYFALRRDKSVVWSPTGKSCVAYRVTSGVMLASGDPLGDPEAWPGAIAQFVDGGQAARVDPGGGRRAARPAPRCGSARRASTRSRSATRPSSRSTTSPSTAARCATSGRWSTGSPRRLRVRAPPAARHPRRRARRAAPARGGVAGRRHRARFLDGARAGSATPPTATASSPPRRRTARCARSCSFVPWGARRAVARPHAPRPRLRPGRQRAAHRRDAAARRRARRRARLAELRGLPRLRSRAASGSVPARARGPGDGCCSSPRAGPRSSRCTGSTRSSSRSGNRASSLPGRRRPAPRRGGLPGGRGVHQLPAAGVLARSRPPRRRVAPASAP